MSAQADDVPLPHCVSGAAQAGTQTPAEHAWPAAQAVPQSPQSNGSFCVSAQIARAPLPHRTSGAAHPAAQAPPEQTWPAGQAL
jgi:hypothetical protein